MYTRRLAVGQIRVTPCPLGSLPRWPPADSLALPHQSSASMALCLADNTMPPCPLRRRSSASLAINVPHGKLASLDDDLGVLHPTSHGLPLSHILLGVGPCVYSRTAPVSFTDSVWLQLRVHIFRHLRHSQIGTKSSQETSSSSLAASSSQEASNSSPKAFTSSPKASSSSQEPSIAPWFPTFLRGGVSTMATFTVSLRVYALC